MPPEVVALADRVQARLERGDLAGPGPIDFGDGEIVAVAETAARIVLADVAHRAEQDAEPHGPVTAAHRADLAVQLRVLLRSVRRRS
jgi:hypothetical protein